MQSSFSRKPLALLVLAALCTSLAAPLAARAESDAPSANAAGVGVARISYLHGSVSLQRGDSSSATAAAINAPVLGADYVSTGPDARAEIQFDGASSVRLGSNVQMRFTHLDTGDRELQLAEGTIELRLLRGADGRTQIDTPSISLRPRETGAYRVTVDSDGRTYATVRAGGADVVTPQGTRALASGTTLLAQGTAANPSLQELGSAIAYDDFDTFNTSRDEREQRALADAAYVAPGVPGIDDLDAYGRWVSDPNYGHVWAPYHVAADWAPYRDGRWAWEDNYGWTWIGYEPWGWAPYHYGRWYHTSLYGWCWYPDPFVTVWQPALVGFFTFGNGFGLGFGNIAWVPLAPLEPFHPWWGRGPTIVNVTNVTNNYYYSNNNANVTKIYGNAKYNGVTYVPRHNFETGRFERPLTVSAPASLHAQIVRGAVPVVPTKENLRYSDRPVAADAAPRTGLLQRRFAGNPVVVQRTPFEQQRAEVAKLARAEIRRADLAPQSPARRSIVPVTELNRVTPNAGATTRNAGAPTNASAATSATVGRGNDPWARFGASRGVPETVRGAPSHVTVIDGTAGARGPATETTRTRANAAVGNPAAHDPQAWSRFDGSAPRRATAAQTVRSSDGAQAVSAPARGTETGRSYAAPQRTYEAPQRTYEAPRQSQPVRSSAPGGTTTTTTTGTTSHATGQRGESRGSEAQPHH